MLDSHSTTSCLHSCCLESSSFFFVSFHGGLLDSCTAYYKSEAMTRTIAAFALLCLRFATAKTSTAKPTICPIQGQQFPAPTGLAQEASFHKATREIEDVINANLTEAPFNETTFSLGMFSTTDDGLLYEYHHTDPSVANSTLGATKVDANSIYRIASITKILTIYLWLIKDGDRRFNHPITDFIPELKQANELQQQYATPDWDEVTIGDLAMYLAGAARDCGLHRGCAW